MALTLPKLVLLLPVLMSATGVTSQDVTVSNVKTTSLQLQWQKEGEWADVVTYQVKIEANGHPFCEKTQNCFLLDSCTFQTEDKCSMFPPCAEVVAWVTGGNYTAPSVSVQTAPERVTDLQVTGLFESKTVTWTNPNSSCFVDTVALVVYGGYYNYDETLNSSESSISVSLCNKGSGFVQVRARGGDGEASPQTAILTRVDGTNAVAITSCPNEGCTDMTVEWDYEPVCPSVTHFEITASLGPFTVASATTDLTNTSCTFEDLALDTVYKTCVSAFDKEENLMTTSCSTSCGTYPEIVDELKVVNVTDTTAELEWEPPLCLVNDNIEYRVSSGNSDRTTEDTSILWTDLRPATSNNICVMVQHPGFAPDHVPNCINAFTLPAALEKVEVKIFETTSLFVTWPAFLFTPNMKYLVSWGENLEHSNYTEYHSYTIDGYNETAGPHKVCVQAETNLPPGLRGKKTCQEPPFAVFGDDKPDHTSMIISVSVSAALAVLLSVVVVVVTIKQQKHIRETS